MQQMSFEDRATLLLASVGIYDPNILQWVLGDSERNAERLSLEKVCAEAIEAKDEKLFRENLKILREKWSEWGKEFNKKFPPPKIERIRGYEIVYKK